MLCRSHDGAVCVGEQGSPGDDTGKDGSRSECLWESHRIGRREPESLEGKGTSRSQHARNTVDSQPRYGGNTLCWKQIERGVFKLQKRSYRAQLRGKGTIVRKRQRLLMKSRSAKLLAVRRVSQDHRGKNTAGVEGVKAVPPAERRELADTLHLNSRAKPV